jgi:hypothetical protein
MIDYKIQFDEDECTVWVWKYFEFIEGNNYNFEEDGEGMCTETLWGFGLE